MSGIAGILSQDPQAPPRREVLTAMSDALARCGPDDVHQAELGGAAMVYRALHVSAESRLTRQPVATDDGLLVTWDGRLDNREELLQQLDLEAGLADVEIVVAAYRRWREDFLAPLVGDFAVALWDASERRLYLARDPFAGRPLFFADRPGSMLWASTVRALFASGEVPPEIDDSWVGAYIVNAQGAHRTPFTTVEVVTPGDVVTFTAGGRQRRRFWKPDGGKSIRYPRDEDYEEAFRELFINSVRCRLRAAGPVVAELSGGLDSSSIVCVADRLIAAGEVEATELYTQSWVYDHAVESDERPFMKVVEEHTGREAMHLLEDDYPVLTDFDKARPVMPSPWQNWPIGRRRAIDMLREKGARVLLSGFAGDHLLWSQMEAPSHLADHVVQMRPLELVRDLGRWHREAEHAYPLLMWEGVMKPLWRAVRGSSAHELKFGFAWLSDDLRSKMADYAADSLERGKGGWMLPSRRMRIETIRWGVNDRSWLDDDVENGFETYYPFLDRPLVEFCFAIPFEQFARPHEMRSLHRRALKGILPEETRTRQCKRGPSDAIMHGFRREWPAIHALFAGHDARVYQRGYVDREPFLEELQKIRHGVYGDHAILIRTLQIEVWLRAVEEWGRPAAKVA